MSLRDFIRRRIAASKLGNPRSIWHAAWRGGQIGLMWGSFLAVALILVMVLIALIAITVVAAIRGLEEGNSNDLVVAAIGLVGVFLVPCWWGFVLGAMAGATTYFVKGST